MRLPNPFKKNKAESREIVLSDEQQKWNKMWELWMNDRADSPYAELMTYQSEINNGGHAQYFHNIDNTDDLQREITILKTVLSEKLQRNLQDAYHAHLAMTDNGSDKNAETALEQCDDEFYKSEDEINCILKKYAAKMEL